MTETNGSEVVRVMREAAAQSWRKWREHVAAGTANSSEALELFQESRDASETLMGEIAGRDELAQARRFAAVDDAGPDTDLGLAAACEQARAA